MEAAVLKPCGVHRVLRGIILNQLMYSKKDTELLVLHQEKAIHLILFHSRERRMCAMASLLVSSVYIS